MNAAEGNLMMKYGKYDGIYQSAVFSSDNSLIALDVYKSIHISQQCDLNSIEHKCGFTENLDSTSYACTYAFSPDGTMLATLRSRWLIQFWEINKWRKTVWIKNEHSSNVVSLSYSI